MTKRDRSGAHRDSASATTTREQVDRSSLNPLFDGSNPRGVVLSSPGPRSARLVVLISHQASSRTGSGVFALAWIRCMPSGSFCPSFKGDGRTGRRVRPRGLRLEGEQASLRARRVKGRTLNGNLESPSSWLVASSLPVPLERKTEEPRVSHENGAGPNTAKPLGSLASAPIDPSQIVDQR